MLTPTPKLSTLPPHTPHAPQTPHTPVAPAADPTPAPVPTDPTAYYGDYWLYASYYGEAAARVYYALWSPPEGTLPPPGTVLPVIEVT